MWPNGPLTLLTRMAEHAAPSMEMRFAGDLPLPLRSCGVWKEDASRATSFVVAAVYASTEGVSVKLQQRQSGRLLRLVARRRYNELPGLPTQSRPSGSGGGGKPNIL